jgi:hypothetical protein
MVMLLAVAGLSGAGATQAAAEAPPLWHSNSHEVSNQPIPTTIWGELKLSSEALGTSGEGEIHCKNVMGSSVYNEGGKGLGSIQGWGTNACKAPQLEEALSSLYKNLCEQKRLKCPITVFATAELPIEQEEREAEVCSEESKTKLKECPSETERETKMVLWHTRRETSSFPWKFELTRAERKEEPVNVLRIGIPPAGKSCYPTELVTLENGEEAEEPAKWQNVPAGCVKITVVAPQVPDEVVFYGSLEPTLIDGAGNGLNASRIVFNAEAGKLKAEKGSAPDTTSSGTLRIAGSEAEQLIFAK